MLCCQNCFNDPYLNTLIKEAGIKGDCSFCDSKSVACINPEDLNSEFLPIINLFSPVESFASPQELEGYEGSYLWEKIQDVFNIFHENTKLTRYELFKRIVSKQLQYGERELIQSYYDRAYEFYGFEDKEAKKLEDEWVEFSQEMKSKNRFFPSSQIDHEKLKYLLQFKDTKINDGEILYRSRKSTNSKKFTPSQMGKPPANIASNGRANPTGIPYLYLASNETTAIAEIRPTINEVITVGRFKVIEPLSIIKLNDISPFDFVESEDFEILINKIGYLKKLGQDLSKPINPEAADLEYLPTQYLCEFIKSCGWDGVAYQSSLADGYNLAVFNDAKLKCTYASIKPHPQLLSSGPFDQGTINVLRK